MFVKVDPKLIESVKKNVKKRMERDPEFRKKNELLAKLIMERQKKGGKNHGRDN